MVAETKMVQTEIGLIPEDWEVKELGELGNVIIGLTYSPNDVSEYGTLVLRSSNIQNNRLTYYNNVFVNVDLPERVIVKENDLLICVRNGSRDLIGKSVLIDKTASGCAFGAFMSIYRSDLNAYISKSFQSGIVQKQIENNLGATINQITNKDLKSFIIPLPPLPEQQAIAEALSDADAWIESLEKLIAKKRLIKQGAMQELLTPKEDWEVKKLGEVGKCLRGVSYSGDSDLSENENEYTIKLLRSNNVYNSKVVFENIQNVNALKVKNQQIIMPNDVLICMANGSKDLVGKAGFCNNSFDKNKYTFGAFMGIFRLFENVNPYFIYLNFLTKNYRNYIDLLLSGSSINNLKPSDIESIEFRLPSKLEQTHIATILSDMDAELEALEEQLSKARQIKQGMMQELLTGRVRLV